jgi:glycosyltransferase involved in cell wall biosynthesis
VSSYDISVISAVYNVARFLPEYIASLEAQKGVNLSRVQVVVVDDGSTDDSLQVLKDWATRSALHVTVLTKENGGQGSARNLGLTVAEGSWVTFLDPDDTIVPAYFAEVLRFAKQHPEVELVATARWMHNEATGEITNSHPLKHMFAEEQLLDLNLAPSFFHGSAPAAFFRLERLRATGLTFDSRIRPNFEDGYFCVRYLLDCERPFVGFVPAAKYHYRKRADNSSTLNNSLLETGRYTVVPRLGYLDVLRRSAEATGHAAGWLQNYVLYELSWYFSSEASMSASQTAATGAVAAEFIGLLREIVDLLDHESVDEFSIRSYDSAWRDILLHGVYEEPWHAPYAVLGPVDRHRNLVRVITRYCGPEPEIEYLSHGEAVTPTYTKVRSHIYFDNALVLERLSWVPASDSLQVRVDGRLVEVRTKWPRPTRTHLNLGGVPPEQQSRWARRVRHPWRSLGSVRRRALRRCLTAPPIAHLYRDAWVLMDRIHDADDSGEHLFHYLREHRPDINAWFVLERGTPDWRRLEPQLGRRLVAHDSWRWLVLMLSCTNLISSHVDRPVHKPHQVMRLLKGGRPTWRFSFLQHGVIKDDLSRWLNPKFVDLFVTSTSAELESVVGDGSQYVYTDRETKLTGLPRFDRLLEAASRIATDGRDLVLVAPTWRQWLMPPLEKGSQRRTVREDFLETDYATHWLGFLRDGRLAELCATHGLKVGFLPHPNLQSILASLHLPEHVVPLSFTDNQVQELFARAAVMVTDYSSMAFNAAYLDRPVVYFQFDADAIKTGAHVGREGYFDYARDGFGPVVAEVSDAIAAVQTIVEQGSVPAETYLKRNADTFVLRDGRCCERVIAAIEALGSPA